MPNATLHRVLLIEDSEEDAELVERGLGSGFAVTRAKDPDGVEAALAGGRWDLVLSAWSVPGLDTPTLLRSLAEEQPPTPYIALLDDLPAADPAEAMELGARDYFQKAELVGLRSAALREIEHAKSAEESRLRELELSGQNSRLLAETAQQQELFAALHTVAQAAVGELDVRRLVELIVKTGRGLLGDVAGGLTLWDAEGQRLRVVGEWCLGVPDGTEIPAQGAQGTAFSSRKPVIVNDYPHWLQRIDLGSGVGLRSILAVPLIAGGSPIGTLAFVTFEPFQFTDRNAEMAMMLAAQIAPAIVTARSHEQLARRAAKLLLIGDLGRAAAGRVKEEQLAAIAMEGLIRVLNAESIGILVASGDDLQATAAKGWLKDLGGALGSSHDLGPAGTLADAGRLQSALGMPDATTCSGFNIEHLGNPALLVACRSTGAGFSDSDHNFLGSVGIMLTEASRSAAAERSLRESDARYQMLFDSALEGVWYVNLEGRTVYANRRMAEILHTDLANLKKHSSWDFYDPATRAAMQLRHPDLSKITAGRYERNLVGADGHLIKASIAASPTRDAEGTLTGMVALVTDLSDRVAAEEAVAQSAAKSGFLAGMSHELRTPLNSILGFTQLLQDPAFGPLTERQQRYIGHVRGQGQHLLELINDVLDLTKVAAGRIEFARERVDLATVVKDTTERLGQLAAAKNQEVVIQVAPGAAVIGDRLRVTQCMINLLSNALKFTPEGGHIAITAAARGAYFAISVADDGPGIAPQDQATAFDEFSKLSAGRRGEGTGLGLSVTRRLVEAMGGRVSLLSDIGQGCVFTMELPAA